MILSGSHGSWVSAILVFTAVQGIFCLQCEVGVNNETSAMQCERSWDKMQEMMKEKMGGKWEEMKTNLTGDMTGLMEQLKKKFDELKHKYSGINIGRRKREVEDLTLFRVKRAEEAAAEPEPESEPEGDVYYCIKKYMGGNTVKSCLPKSIADPLKMACGLIPGAGTVCVCNDEDLCNTGHQMGWSRGLLVMVMVAAVWNRF